jgi:hypothetical protein
MGSLITYTKIPISYLHRTMHILVDGTTLIVNLILTMTKYDTVFPMNFHLLVFHDLAGDAFYY